MNRSLSILATALTLSLSSSVLAFAHKHQTVAAKGKAMITCPIMKTRVAKSKAIAVKTKSGKTVYVCCKSCVTAAKQLK